MFAVSVDYTGTLEFGKLCEKAAAKMSYTKFSGTHEHLKLVVTEDCTIRATYAFTNFEGMVELCEELTGKEYGREIDFATVSVSPEKKGLTGPHAVWPDKNNVTVVATYDLKKGTYFVDAWLSSSEPASADAKFSVLIEKVPASGSKPTATLAPKTTTSAGMPKPQTTVISGSLSFAQNMDCGDFFYYGFIRDGVPDVFGAMIKKDLSSGYIGEWKEGREYGRGDTYKNFMKETYDGGFYIIRKEDSLKGTYQILYDYGERFGLAYGIAVSDGGEVIIGGLCPNQTIRTETVNGFYTFNYYTVKGVYPYSYSLTYKTKEKVFRYGYAKTEDTNIYDGRSIYTFQGYSGSVWSNKGGGGAPKWYLYDTFKYTDKGAVTGYFYPDMYDGLAEEKAKNGTSPADMYLIPNVNGSWITFDYKSIVEVPGTIMLVGNRGDKYVDWSWKSTDGAEIQTTTYGRELIIYPIKPGTMVFTAKVDGNTLVTEKLNIKMYTYVGGGGSTYSTASNKASSGKTKCLACDGTGQKKKISSVANYNGSTMGGYVETLYKCDACNGEGYK